jgi:ATP-dependent DNA ligase
MTRCGIHEIKYDGYRLMARRDATGVRPFTRRQRQDRSAAADHGRLNAKSCLIDGFRR